MCLGLVPGDLLARDHTIDFESEKPTWQVVVDDSGVQVSDHRRTQTVQHAGSSCEVVTVDSRSLVGVGALKHPVPRAQVIEELKATLWVRATHEGARLAVRVVLPNQPNPATGTPLTVLIYGDTQETVNQWEQLECSDIEQKLLRMRPQLRKRLQNETGSYPDLDITGAYVDEVIIELQFGRGSVQIALDDLSLGPIVAARPAASIQSVEHRDAPAKPEAEFHMGRFYIAGRPFFPLVVPYHGEAPEQLAQLHFNIAWVPDYRDTAVLEKLREAGLRSMAIPPRPIADDEGRIDPSAGHLAPFGPETSPIVLWYLGTRIRPEVRRQLLMWDEQIHSADRLLNRPILGDVQGAEREFSRHLSMIGASRAPLHTTLGLKSYREFLAERKFLAKQGSFFYTWIHSEPEQSLRIARENAGQTPIVIEPEQLRLQVYAALSAGAHGLGYWSGSTFDGDGPGAEERRLAAALLNLEIELIEPWLATGAVQSHDSFTATLPAQRNNNPNPLGSTRNPREVEKRDALLTDRKAQERQSQALARELDATILRTDYGTLVLPIWYGEDAQFVPGQMAANDARIVVKGVGDTAGAFEISTTSIDRIVDSSRVAGGRQIGLRRFDTTSVILFTDDMRLVERLQTKMLEMREPSARMSVDLARLKLERVYTTVLALQAKRPQPDAPQILAQARKMLRYAETFLKDGRFHEARLSSGDCLQTLRILQQVFWNDAIQRMYSPVSSPHTLCFHTLPDHWDMVSRFRLARGTGTKNVLRSGDFEDFDTMVTEGWRHDKTDIPGVQATAEVSPQAHQGNYSLRLVAVPRKGTTPQVALPEFPVTVTSPGVTVYRGQLVYISGWVKVSAPITASVDGAMLSDSLGGESLALRWRKPVDWHEFHLVREVHETTELTLTVTLSGLGEVFFDDVQVVPLNPNESGSSKDAPATATGKPSGSNPLDFLKKIPGLRPKAEAEDRKTEP